MHIPDSVFDSLAKLLQPTQFWPLWPPRPTLLTGPNLDFSKQSEWGAKEWREYALFLEESGNNLNRELIKTKNELKTANKLKARGRNKHLPTCRAFTTGTLLTNAKMYHPRWYGSSVLTGSKPGRKPGGEAKEIAKLVIAKRAEIEATGKRTTNKEALSALKFEVGRRNWPYHVTDGAIYNAIPKIILHPVKN